MYYSNRTKNAANNTAKKIQQIHFFWAKQVCAMTRLGMIFERKEKLILHPAK